MLRAILPPLLTAYGLFVAMVVVAMVRPAPRPREGGDGDAQMTRRGFGSTLVGGYAAFLVIVLVFHVWLVEEPDAFPSAVWGGAFLCGVALAAAWVSSRIPRRRRR